MKAPPLLVLVFHTPPAAQREKAETVTHPLLQLVLRFPLLFGPRGLPVSGHRLAASAAGQAVHALALAPDDAPALLKAALAQLL